MGRDRNNPLDREDREGPEIIASGPSYPSPYTTGLLNDVLYAPTAERASLHARSQRLRASAHTRQCPMFISVAWCSHSSPHRRHASAQAVQLWAQSKHASMHSTSMEASTAAELG